MLKCLAVLIVLFCLTVVAVPIQQKPSSKQDAQQSSRDAKQANVPAASITNNQATSYYEQPRESKPQGWHKFVAWPEGITTWAIMLTLGAIVWQAWETRKAAITMAQNTAAFTLSQRPIIACDPHEGIHPITDMVTNGRMRLDLVNRGQTSAFHCVQEMWVEFVPRTANTDFSNMDNFEFTEDAIHFAPPHQFSLYPSHTPLVINVPAGRDFSESDKIAMQKAKLFICIRLLVRYRDGFLPNNAPDRFSNFGFWVMYEGLGNLSRYQGSN